MMLDRVPDIETKISVNRPRGRPRRFDDRRMEVLRMAARVFSDRGFRQATLEDVAGALGMTRPALYHYADSKDALLAQCLDVAYNTLSEAVITSRNEALGALRLKAFFRQYAPIVCDDFGRCFVLTDLSEMADVEREATRKVQTMLGKAVSGMVRDGIRDESIAECDPADVSRALFAAFNGITRWHKEKSRRRPQDIADDFLQFFFSGLSPRR